MIPMPQNLNQLALNSFWNKIKKEKIKKEKRNY